jgi:hypothetical protein
MVKTADRLPSRIPYNIRSSQADSFPSTIFSLPIWMPFMRKMGVKRCKNVNESLICCSFAIIFTQNCDELHPFF